MFAVCGSCRTMFALRLWVLRCSAGSRTAAQYVQGQSPEPRIREYFYYLDHQGQVGNTQKLSFLLVALTPIFGLLLAFPRRHQDKQFLVFFFHRLRSNRSGRYQEDFPYVSLCGRERNFLRCDDRPVVFTHLLPGQSGDPALLSYCGGAEKLAVAFRPEALFMHPISGRVYHPCSEQRGGVGLVRSALAMELSPSFAYDGDAETEQPTHFQWGGQRHRLTNELSERFSSQ